MPVASGKAKSKKCQRACERCRSMKVKCSGFSPCTRCARRNKHCHFPVEEVRVSVSERYPETEALGDTHLQHFIIAIPMEVSSELLDSQADIGWRSMSNVSGLRIDSFLPGIEHPLHIQEESQTGQGINNRAEEVTDRSRFSQNPLVDRDPSFAQTPDGRFWYMGPTSSWSFCRRVLALIGRKVPESNCPPDPFHIDGVAFRLNWRPFPPDEVPDVTNLPPLDYALFLFSTVKFYFGFLSLMIDETAYLQDLHEFYRDPPAKAAAKRPWYCQYLLNRFWHTPGHQYASRAMALLPDLSGVDEDPLSCIQALSLAAVYLQSIDMRRAAFQHIGQALRGCIIEGIHRHVPEEICGPELSKRSRIIFWVVYLLDREFSASIGAPSSIRDEDITVRLPAEMDDSVEHVNLTLHVRLSRLMATILTTVYGVGNESDDTLVRSTQSILHSMAALSYDLTDFLNTNFHGLISRASKMAIRLMLAHHHCVVLTTRPLVMCALHMHIERTERETSQTISLTQPVASLLQCCADSAQTILQTLRILADDDLLDAFLPFQIEDASSSAFVLYLIRSIAPSLVSNDTWCESLECVLDKLIAKGNLAGPLRRLELKQLEQILAPLTPKLSTHHLPPVNLDGGNEISEEAYSFDHDEFEWDMLALNPSVSLPPRELLDLADQLDVEGIMQSVGV
ncbi:transcriptional regulator family: Fungal Specific TF [Penicillium paradoxum]|uniref:transcriptional regulator family: Fungal Specific TF n=1 Tax=Penicillium paradoxum TaxID=176176 RepID=UPI002548FB8F|nr:transcriptional regulator family: Fungal Specific TF [Penicillium paradoxum]KAJ5783102.1 transcriptional regulator family: Fungal Specific TF [Penicillium paradoxum]